MIGLEGIPLLYLGEFRGNPLASVCAPSQGVSRLKMLTLLAGKGSFTSASSVSSLEVGY